MSSSDVYFMKRALVLARRGSGLTKPNPVVGAVMVKDGKLVAEGWHRKAGAPHAEVECIQAAGENAKEATLYVTLEPCNHFGKTPPCTEAIVEAGISRVVVAIADPNPNVKGAGVQRLREAGLQVDLGVMAAEAAELNATWIHWMSSGRPLVALKLAATLDGYIAGPEGQRLQLTSTVAMAQVQRLRRHFDAIMVGSRTVLKDDPFLTNRTGKGAQPLRIVIDPKLETDTESNVYRPLDIEAEGPTPIALVATTSNSEFSKRQEFELAGVELCTWEDANAKVDFRSLLEALGRRGVQSIICEGGAELASSLLIEGIVDRVFIYKAPKVLPEGGVSLFTRKAEVGKILASRYKLESARPVGPDALLTYGRRS